jgi:transposase
VKNTANALSQRRSLAGVFLQTAFACTACGHTAHADVNAAIESI